MKVIIIIGLICILIGAIFCGVAYAVGGRYVNSQVTDITTEFNADNVNKININEIVANVNIIKSGGTRDIIIEAEKIIESEFKCELLSNTLKISYNPSQFKFGFINIPSFIYDWRNTPVINIYIPGDKIFDEIYFNGGVGNINAEAINTQSFVISGGVGDFDMKNLTASSLEINSGVGNVKINGTIMGDTKIDGGVGNVKISGILKGNIKLSGGVGNTNLDLTGNVRDYDFKVDKGVGNVKLNGNKIETVRNDGKYIIDINAGVGDININIK